VRRDRGLAFIIGYKLVKGALWLVFAAVILVLMHMGLEDDLLGLAEHLRHHAHVWSLAFARLVVSAASRRGLYTIVVALLADGCVSLFEGWALHHGRWWGPWIVVVATASLLPFEVVAFVRHLHVARGAVLVVNVAIVVYLVRTALAERRQRAADVEGA
jgi:uncharacterized membrane protein (DUF2068 family)